jgi:hypothetical protein
VAATLWRHSPAPPRWWAFRRIRPPRLVRACRPPRR